MDVYYFWRSPDSEFALGGKARSIGLLRSLQWRTPTTEVITDALFRELTSSVPADLWPESPADLEKIDRVGSLLSSAPFPEGFEEALSAAILRLGNNVTRFSIRSSFANEDNAAVLGAGVYESRVDLGRTEVSQAIRDVLRSAVSPGAIAYAQRAGVAPFDGPFAVLLHPFIEGAAHGHAVRDSTGVSFMTLSGTIDEATRVAIESKLLDLPEAATPCEIEWVASLDGPVFLQWRPHVEVPPPALWSGFATLPVGENPADWHWDAAHNPLPLSPAQAGLVALVDERCRIGIRQRVLDGYLFYRTDPDAPASPPFEVRAFLDELSADATVALRQLDSPPRLQATLELIVRFYQPLLGILGPATRQARRALRDFLSTHKLHHLESELLLAVPSSATRRLELLRAFQQRPSDPETRQALLAVIGDEASVWDVAEPTRKETLALAGIAVTSPEETADTTARLLRARQSAENALEQSHHDTFFRLLESARQATAVGEDDDALYARIVAPFRQALLSLGQTLCTSARIEKVDDIFFVPLPVLQRLADGDPLPGKLSSYVLQGRAEHVRALAHPPPIAPTGPPRRLVVTGSGTRGRKNGVVIHHEPGRLDYPPNAILVAVTLLPTELPLLSPAAIVTETGGPQGHVAAQARERGIPAVVGAAGARTRLRPGMRAIVDADAGVVVPIG